MTKDRRRVHAGLYASARSARRSTARSTPDGVQARSGAFSSPSNRLTGWRVTRSRLALIPASIARCIHDGASSVDIFYGVLLLVGIRLSQRPATSENPFGQGKELYF